MDIKEYEMKHDYAIKNFCGLSLEEQIKLLDDLKKFAIKTKDKWLIDNFKETFGYYLYRLKSLVYSPKKYPRLREDIKMLYRINKSRDFYDEWSRCNLKSLEELNDNLEYNIGGKSYYDDSYSRVKFINPDRIYLQDLYLKDDYEKEDFYVSLIIKFNTINKRLALEYLPKRVIELYDPIILDIYGEDIFNYIKSIHHSFNMEIIDYLSNWMPYNNDSELESQLYIRDIKNHPINTVFLLFNDVKDFSVDEFLLTGEYDKEKNDIVIIPNTPNEFDNLEEELEYVRSKTMEKIKQI